MDTYKCGQAVRETGIFVTCTEGITLKFNFGIDEEYTVKFSRGKEGVKTIQITGEPLYTFENAISRTAAKSLIKIRISHIKYDSM